jgi:hypothetical protein
VKFTRDVSMLATCLHFLSDIIDSHKVYYGKFLFAEAMPAQRCS